jgi:integrase
LPERVARKPANGTDPSAERKEQKRAAIANSTSFEQVFREWLDIQRAKLAKCTSEKIRASMTIHALPRIGSYAIADIKVDDILTMLRAIEIQGALEMARRVRVWTSRVFRYAVITGKCERDPSGDLRGALRVPQVKHHAALSTPEIPAFMKGWPTHSRVSRH